ncbi:MAG: mechanosensitive ion channel family protein [bacterium]
MPLFDPITKILDRTYFNNTLGTWLAAALAGLAALVIFLIARVIIKRRMRALAETTITQIDDFIVELLQRTRPFFLLTLALYAGTRPLTLPERVESFIQQLAIILSLLQVGIWSNHSITFWMRRYVRERVTQDAASVTSITTLGFIGRIVLWAVVLMVALDNIGLNITALVAGLGIGGIAVALAAQNILGDLFASLSIVMDKPFVLGDTVVVGDFTGTVEHIGLKTTRLRSVSGEQLIFTNGDLLQSRIRNFTRMSERRALFTVGVVYQTPEAKLARIPHLIKEIVTAQPGTRFDRAHFKSFGDFSLNFETVYFVQSADFTVYMDTQQAVNLALFRRFAEEGIEFAYPTQMVYTAKENLA